MLWAAALWLPLVQAAPIPARGLPKATVGAVVAPRGSC